MIIGDKGGKNRERKKGGAGKEERRSRAFILSDFKRKKREEGKKIGLLI